MSSAGGLTRRRGGGGGNGGDNENEGSRTGTPSGAPREGRAPETSFTGGENGHKIAFDPRDMADNEERSKQPKLTLMEEVLLMGLKDKQVRADANVSNCAYCQLTQSSDPGLSLFLERQHIVRSTRMHCHRAGISRSREHAEGFIAAALSPRRSYHRSHRRYINRRSPPRRSSENDEDERKDER